MASMINPTAKNYKIKTLEHFSTLILKEGARTTIEKHAEAIINQNIVEIFKPYGYSLNAIKDDKYLTVHITPQANSSYISFESNIDLIVFAPLFIDILQPLSFDILSFNEFEFSEKTSAYRKTNYVSKTLVKTTLSNGYKINFANFILPQVTFIEPIVLTLEGEGIIGNKTL